MTLERNDMLSHRCNAILVYQAAAMSATPKRKLCWNCDGSLALAVDQCTYCGASLKEGAAPPKVKKKPIDSLAPPYAMLQEGSNGVAPQPPFDVVNKQASVEETQEVSAEPSHTTEATNVFSSLLFLLGGSVFCLFGLVLWLFSQDGVFTLHWNGDYWYVYTTGGAALLFLGWRTMRHLNDSPPTDEQA